MALKQESKLTKIIEENMRITPPLSPLMPVSDDSNMDLLSEEKLDRSSPELWPEQIPGVSKFASLTLSPNDDKPVQQPEWLRDLDHEDISVLQGFGSLTAAALLEKVRDLQNLAYQLGLEEVSVFCIKGKTCKRPYS
ncbi:protein lin-52 homolog isoform X2 [Stegodyphus dumicola]|uniref:protein lin-52 homolog isoform X2 n=1 Tax=Stegodyphus dumicola TaxID=202533 RepID=UPI0015ABEC68|nr:protein lin-52 homolog isoform X2 [Stegodyphus dumicola]